MDDLISIQAAIDAINKPYDVSFCELPLGNRSYSDIAKCLMIAYDKGKEDAIKHIQDLPSAHPEQRWIPCSERLPEVNGRYLVTRGLNACGSLWNRIYIANYSDLMGLKSERIWWNGNVGKSDFERIDDVIAWMPLPEPYREEGDYQKSFLESIDDQPTIGPVRKGKWIVYVMSMLDGEDCKCSECGHKSCAPYWNFCPYCGAKMEEGEE